MAEERVLSFINEHNRPYSVQLVSDMLAQFGLKKGPIQKALESLADSNKLVCKEFGKTKIYIPIQDPTQELSPEAMENLLQKKTKLQEEAKEVGERVHKLSQALQALNSTLTSQEIVERTTTAQTKVDELTKQLQQLKSGGILISAEEKAAVHEAFSANVRAWQKRKSIFNSIWGELQENLEGNQAELLEGMGVETDESLDLNLKEFQQLLPKKVRTTGSLR
eukprot:jgi/Botrbrau1/13052/Bobra.0187s0014.1